MKNNFDHIRHEPSHVMAPGLFRSVKRGDYEKLKLDVTYNFGNGESLEFGAKEPLGVPEMRALQGLIAMAGTNSNLLTPNPISESGQRARDMLDMRFDALNANALLVKGSYRALAKCIGYSDIENTKRLQKSIERLWYVSVIVRKNNQHMGFRLISQYATNHTEGLLYVALNPLIASAVLNETRYCRISLNEVRALKTDPARLMHQRLCGWINQGKLGRVAISTLCGYIWFDEATAIVSNEAMKKRLQTVRRALKELENLEWVVLEYETDKFQISRPKKPMSQLP